VAKLIYRPIGLLVSVLGGILAGALFKQMWKRVSDKEDPPRAKESEYGWREVLPAAALQGALFGLVKAAVDRSGAASVSEGHRLVARRLTATRTTPSPRKSEPGDEEQEDHDDAGEDRRQGHGTTEPSATARDRT
jgi:hypothetical protein